MEGEKKEGPSARTPPGNAFNGGPVQPRTIGLDQSVQMTIVPVKTLL